MRRYLGDSPESFSTAVPSGPSRGVRDWFSAFDNFRPVPGGSATPPPPTDDASRRRLAHAAARARAAQRDAAVAARTPSRSEALDAQARAFGVEPLISPLNPWVVLAIAGAAAFFFHRKRGR